MADPATIAQLAVAAGSTISGLFGNNSSKDDDLQRAEIQRKKDARKLRDSINEYNKKKDKIEKENYYNNRDYAFDTAIKGWERRKEIQDFEYQSSLDAYNERLRLSQGQLDLNAEGAETAIATTQAALKDYELGLAFQREGIYADLENTLINQGFEKQQQNLELFKIKSNERIQTESIQTELKNLFDRTAFDKETASIKALQDSGKSALSQAGKSRNKSIQSAQAESFRTLTQLDSSLKGSRRSAGVQLLKLKVDTSIGETGVGINMDRIDQAIKFAKEEALFNNRILEANKASRIAQTERDIAAIDLQRRGADLRAEASVGIMPQKLPYEVMPEITPERIFLPSRKVTFEELLGPQAPIPSTEPSTSDTIQAGFNLASAGLGLYNAFNTPSDPLNFKSFNLNANNPTLLSNPLGAFGSNPLGAFGSNTLGDFGPFNLQNPIA